MNKVFCSKCKNYQKAETINTMHRIYNFPESCIAPLSEHTSRIDYMGISKKSPQEINQNNDCEYYEEIVKNKSCSGCPNADTCEGMIPLNHPAVILSISLISLMSLFVIYMFAFG